VNLPGILSERFFNLVDLSGDSGIADEYIDSKKFMKAMFRIYYSPLETKFKLVFDMYDFDGDGLISKEDIHLVLSHIPMSVTFKSFTYIEK
jgi:Ca2+-binding EF-hand superfamily protein